MKLHNLLLLFLLVLFSCSKEPIDSSPRSISTTQISISENDLPQPIKSYVETNFPNDFIVDAKKTDNNRYELALRTKSIIGVGAKKQIIVDEQGNSSAKDTISPILLHAGLIECFAFIYPLQFTVENQSFEAQNRSELNQSLIDWYTENKNSTSVPVLTYPIDIEYEDGSRTSIPNRNGLLEAFENCYPGFFYWIHQNCYVLNYPLRFRMPDDSEIEGKSRSNLIEQLKEWYDEHPDILVKPELIYPVNLTQEDNETIQVHNSEELEELFNDCRERGLPYFWHRNWNWLSPYEWYWNVCIEWVYPMTYEMPDGTAIEVESKRDGWIKLKQWYADHPNEDTKPEIKYPITILDKENEEKIIQNKEELEAEYDDCFKQTYHWNWDWSWRWDWGYAGWHWNWGRCYTLVYPISYTLPDGSQITGENRSEILRKFKSWYDEHPNENKSPKINFPITIMDETHTSIVINSEDGLEEFYLDCYRDWGSSWKAWGESWKSWDEDWKDWNQVWQDWWEKWKEWWENWWNKNNAN